MALLSLLAVPASTPAQFADGAGAEMVEVQVNVGFSETVRIGHWIPVTVTLSNRGPGIAGDLELVLPAGAELRGGRYTATYRRPLSLPGGARKRFRFTVYLESIAEPLAVRVVADGRVVARESIDLRSRVTSARLVLVLSRDADLDYLNDPRLGHLRVAYAHPDLLPERWQAYEGVAAVIVHGVSLERLDELQFDALREWIVHGGTLAVSGGPDYTLLHTPRLAELLPGLPTGLMRVDAAEVPGSRRFVDGVFDAHRVPVYEGRSVLRTDELALVMAVERGRGKVVYLAFDVTRAPFRRWLGMAGLWQDVLALPAAETLAARLDQRRQGDRVRDFAQLAGERFPHRLVVVLFLALYLGVLYIGVPSRGAGGAWRAIATWGRPLLFVPVAWLLFDRLLFPPATSAFAASMVQPHDDGPFAELTVNVAWYSNRSDDMRLEYASPQPSFRPVPDTNEGRTPNGDWVFAEGSPPALRPLAGRGFRLYMVEGEDVVDFDLDVRVERAGDGLSVSLENRSGRALSAAWLVLHDRLHPLGAVEAGAEWSRVVAATDPAALSTGGAPWFEALRQLRGHGDEVARAGRIANAYLRARGWPDPEPDRVYVVGLAADPLRLAGTSADWRREGTAVVMIERELPFVHRGGDSR